MMALEPEYQPHRNACPRSYYRVMVLTSSGRTYSRYASYNLLLVKHLARRMHWDKNRWIEAENAPAHNKNKLEVYVAPDPWELLVESIRDR